MWDALETSHVRSPLVEVPRKYFISGGTKAGFDPLSSLACSYVRAHNFPRMYQLTSESRKRELRITGILGSSWTMARGPVCEAARR